jgi:hypothetical protein
MRRWAKRVAGALPVVILILAAPVLWIETACTTAREPGTLTRVPLVAERGYARRESDSYLSFPEWHIVYAYEDLAGVLRRGEPSDFAYDRQIGRFWTSLCRLTRVVSARGAVGTDTKVMLYTIGWSFTAELAIKGAYETTFGRLFEWRRGPGRTAEDEFVAQDMDAYARFLRQTPWYEYPFGRRLLALRSTPLGGKALARKLERRVVVSLEYGTKAVYGALIGYASGRALGGADLEIHSVVRALDGSDAPREPEMRIVRELGEGRTLIRTPRSQAYTDLLVRLARRGRDVVEIAGNHRILVTVLAPPGTLPPLSGVVPLFEAPIQSRPSTRRVGLDVPVEQLAATIRALEPAGIAVEHVYDY